MDSTVQDFRIALRALSRRPLYSGVVVVTLALGIGAATAMFSVVDRVLLRPLPYEEPGQLVTIWQTMPSWREYAGNMGEQWDHTKLTYSQYRDLSEKSELLVDVAAYYAGVPSSVNLTGAGDPIRLRAGAATASLLPLLGVQPWLGRWFLPSEVASRAGNDGASVAVLSHELWKRRFAGSPGILGETMTFDDRPLTIVGVLPPGFRIHWMTAAFSGEPDPGRRDVWFPIGAQGWEARRTSYMWETIARLAPGTTLEAAREEASSILSEHPHTEGHLRVFGRTAEQTQGLSSPLALLFGGTVLLLLAACGNVATLSMAEMAGRRREMATRSALGAGRVRIVRLLSTEAIVLAALGSLIGAAVALVGTRALVVLAPPIRGIDVVAFDLRAFIFATLTGTGAAFLFGIVPSVVASRDGRSRALAGSARGIPGPQRSFGTVLAVEIALTAVLLVASGLLTRSMSRLMAVDPGFDAGGLATVEVMLPRTRYPSPQAQVAFVRDVLGRLRAIPGIGTVSAANSLPFPGTTSGWGIMIEGRDQDGQGMTFVYHVEPGYLETLGARLLSGRYLADTDGPDASLAVVINEAMARRFWPDESPVGARFLLSGDEEPITVVGIVGNLKKQVLNEEAEPAFYIPFSQFPNAYTWNRTCFVARTDVGARGLIPSMREAVWSIDEEIPVENATTVAALISSSADRERFRTLLMNVFGIITALLAAAGVFGVTARNVAMRSRELAIRMALGARVAGLVGAALQSILYVGVAGTAVGLLGALWMSRLLSRFLFGITPSDPTTYGLVGASILTVCLVAALFPARRVSRVDPVEVLRQE